MRVLLLNSINKLAKAEWWLLKIILNNSFIGGMGGLFKFNFMPRPSILHIHYILAWTIYNQNQKKRCSTRLQHLKKLSDLTANTPISTTKIHFESTTLPSLSFFTFIKLSSRTFRVNYPQTQPEGPASDTVLKSLWRHLSNIYFKPIEAAELERLLYI